MKKFVRLWAVLLVVFSLVGIMGCSNQTKQFMELREASYKVTEECVKLTRDAYPEGIETESGRVAFNKTIMEKLETNKKTVEKNLQEMEVLAGKDSTMLSDCQMVRANTLVKITNCIDTIKQTNETYSRLMKIKKEMDGRYGK